jgi:hypothetical protein
MNTLQYGLFGRAGYAVDLPKIQYDHLPPESRKTDRSARQVAQNHFVGRTRFRVQIEVQRPKLSGCYTVGFRGYQSSREYETNYREAPLTHEHLPLQNG